MHACMRVEGAGGQRPQRTVVRGAPGRRYDPCVARGVGRRCGSRRVGRSDLRACRLGRGTGRRAVPRWRRASADALTARQEPRTCCARGRGPRIAAWSPWDGRHGMSVQNRHHIEPHTANRRYSTVNSLDTPPAVLPFPFAPVWRGGTSERHILNACFTQARVNMGSGSDPRARHTHMIGWGQWMR